MNKDTANHPRTKMKMKTIGEKAHAHSQIEKRAIGTTTERQDEAYENLPIHQSIKINLQR